MCTTDRNIPKLQRADYSASAFRGRSRRTIQGVYSPPTPWDEAFFFIFSLGICLPLLSDECAVMKLYGKNHKYNKMLVGCIMYNLISYCVAFDGSIGVCWRFPVHSDGWRIKRICTKTFRYPRSWKRKQWRVEQLKWCCGKLWDACCRQGECATIEMILKKIIACETNFSTQIVLNVK